MEEQMKKHHRKREGKTKIEIEVSQLSVVWVGFMVKRGPRFSFMLPIRERSKVTSNSDAISKNPEGNRSAVALAIGKDVILLSNGGEILSFMGVLEVCKLGNFSDLSKPSQHKPFLRKPSLCCCLRSLTREEEKEEAERGESNSHEKLRSRYSKRQKGRKYDFGKSKMQPQRYDSWRLQNCFPRSHPIICYFYFPHQFAFV
uniref:Uncharacterized protein n=1 Tax=Salix viminalis TaxID=40686 RepID=A0A6N2KTD9_SALVM